MASNEKLLSEYVRYADLAEKLYPGDGSSGEIRRARMQLLIFIDMKEEIAKITAGSMSGSYGFADGIAKNMAQVYKP